MEFTGQLRGISNLDKVFSNLKRTTQSKAINQALRKGGYIVRDSARKNVESVAVQGYSTGLLARNLRVYTFRRYKGMFRVAVQVKRGLYTKDGTRVGLYAAILEYGKDNQPPRSWIRKAIRDNKNVVYETVRSEMNKRMVDAVREARR